MECWKTRRTHPCKIILLDHQEIIEEMTESTKGSEIMNGVFKHLNIIETAHFGLRYIDPNNQTHWLDSKKTVFKQLKGKTRFTLYFGVKFYAVDPCKLTEEVTRYQFFLQLKQDILQGRLPVSFELAVELGAYLVQSELGDFDPRRHTAGYVSEFRFVSNQTVEMENKIAELHKELVGQQPALAELNYLEKVKWLEMYGVDLHPVLGEDNTEYFLGLTPTGVIVLRNKNKVASYFWPRITKIFHKGKYFMIRINDKKNEENTFGFETPSKGACRHLYKCSIEHHNFFRQTQSTANPSGLKDSTEYGRSRANQPFVRVPSRRFQRRIIENVPAKSEEKVIEQESPSPTETNLFSQIEQWKRSDSPRSTQSLPPARGLYSSNLRISSSRRSVSVESRSSNDSKSCKSNTRHNSKRRGSDNESEISKCSGKSRRRRTRSKHSSGSERDHRKRRSSSSQKYVLVDSKEQWKEVQRKQAEGCLVQKAKVITSTRSHSERGYVEKDHEFNHHKSRRHRKHRSRSPSETKTHMPEELKKHLQFSLVDTAGMTESQLREIPYKVVETSTAKAIRIKLSPTTRKAYSSSHRTKR
ncbi:band 4.1-like protein 4A isoform X2 [Cimex lectularius]|nr:band 4.1-like protein 4A isoform X2 [Cimex lectularius]